MSTQTKIKSVASAHARIACETWTSEEPHGVAYWASTGLQGFCESSYKSEKDARAKLAAAILEAAQIERTRNENGRRKAIATAEGVWLVEHSGPSGWGYAILRDGASAHMTTAGFRTFDEAIVGARSHATQDGAPILWESKP